ncbi:MAG: phosphotransferase [Dehalococcoidia bacterium]|nr:phosphotransferase [Dehalococcoidia bacterium]
MGRVFRCALQYDREEATAPPAVIAKFPTEDLGYRSLLDQFAVYEREVRFYSELRDDCPIPTPVCYFADRDPASGDFLILLEDLAPAQPGKPIAGCTRGEALAAVELIAKMHSRWWTDKRLDSLEWLATPDVPRMELFISRNYHDAWRAFARRSSNHLPAHLSRAGRLLGRHLLTVLRRLSSPPRTLVHGDFQLGNIFFSEAGTIRAVADWQVVVRARGPMDLGHFVVRSLDPAERRTAEADLIRRYHEILVRSGIEAYSLQDCWDDYRLSVLSQFGLGIVLEYALSRHKREEPAEDAALQALSVVSGRLFAAIDDLRPEELLPREPLWRRYLPSSWGGQSQAQISG